MMGKINNKTGVEIIPLNEVNNRNNRSISRVEQRMKMERLPYMSDPTIVPRVQKYLESNVDKTYVDINVMADDLQRSYREYGRRKRNAFRNSVKKAYSIVLQSYGIEDRDNSTTGDEEASDESALDEGANFHNNQMNNQLVELYTGPTVPKQIDENELIDISSDDSEATVQAFSTDKASNGPSTSQDNYHNNVTKKPAEHSNSKHLARGSDRGKKRKSDAANLTPYRNIAKKRSIATFVEPSLILSDIKGMDDVMRSILGVLWDYGLVQTHKGPKFSRWKGYLLHGPHGCGKTMLAEAIAGHLGIPFLQVESSDLVAGVSGESEKNIRKLFEQAQCSAPCVLFIDELDSIATKRENAEKDMQKRIVAQLCKSCDELRRSEDGRKVLLIAATNRPETIDPALRRGGRFDREIYVGIPKFQSRVDIIKDLTSDLGLGEDFDFESLAKWTPGFVGGDLNSLILGALRVAAHRVFEQNQQNRTLAAQKGLEKKIKDAVKKSASEPKSDHEIIVDDDVPVVPPRETSSDNVIVVIDDDTKQASETPPAENAVGEQSLNDSEAATDQEPMPVDVVKQGVTLEEELLWFRNRTTLPEQYSKLSVTLEDFWEALRTVQASVKREGFVKVPDVSWNDIGSLTDLKEQLKLFILALIKCPKECANLRLNAPGGILLCGPPGCGKTLLAKAVANEAGINFISVKGPELLNKYVGESEKAVRTCFQRAKDSAPCVIFFDELDSICGKRDDFREAGPTKVVNTLLTEMDGFDGKEAVFILAATNRPEMIDPAVLRPGRLDKVFYVGLPTASDRVDILRAITKNGTSPSMAPDVDLEVIGKSEQCRGYTGADLNALVKGASTIALAEFLSCEPAQRQPAVVTAEHFKRALAQMKPSVPEKDHKHYEKLRKLYSVVQEQEVEEMEYS